jgi:hypothetical protein
MKLIKSLPRIAARILQNTHVGRMDMTEKFELIEAAYGRAVVEEDFEKWCEEVRDRNPRYPLTEYIKVVDSRLGRGFEEKRADLKDPRIADIASLSYEKTGVLPSARSVGNLLLDFSPEEIKAALNEYASTLDDKEVKSGMRAFFTEAGCVAVIMSQRRRKENSRG